MPEFLLAIKAWSIWSRLGTWLSAFATWASKNPWIALAVLSIALNVVQLVIHKRDLAKAAAFKVAQVAAVAIEKKDDAGASAAVVKLNGVTDHDYEDGVADGRAQLAAWFAAHQPGAGGMRGASASSGAGTPAEDHAAPVVADPAGGTTVAFTEDQLKGWDLDYDSAVACQTWAAHIAAMFDGKHWPTPAEVQGLPLAPAKP